jgi:hypothetical protein
VRSRPSPLDGAAWLAPQVASRSSLARPRIFSSEPARNGPTRLHLGSRLPLNLRHFLSNSLGPDVRVEEDTIVALGPRSSEAVMRDLARAIRRFSAVRAREAWRECAIAIERLEREFFNLPAEERGPVVLCLRCACVDAGPLEQHNGRNCLAVDLGGAVEASRHQPRREPLAETLHRAVERFRRERVAAGFEHYDLDCYVANRQVVFSWRPLAPPAS